MTSLSNFILEKLDTLIVVINLKGEITYINPSVKKLLGYEPERLIGQNWVSTSMPTSAEIFAVKKSTIQLLKEQKNKSSQSGFSTEAKIKDSFGRERWVFWNLSLGPENSIVGIGQDISERKLSENKILQNNRMLKERNREVMDSIRYSERIQKAILPNPERIKAAFDQAFIYYKPKDIVSGDFYWFQESNDRVYLAAIDCTGHGVPGALMTVLANSLLKNCVRQGMTDPGEILQKLDESLFEELNNGSEKQTPDGMDIALCVFDFERSNLSFSGAFRPLVLVRESELIEFKGARYPIGFYQEIEKCFETTEIHFQKGDSFYLFSDGYIDQFGGQFGKKFNKKAFKELLLEMQSLNLEEQEGYLDYSFNNWKQQHEQVDDVCLIGVRL